MTAFDYSKASISIRPDIAEAHRGFWNRLAGPGSWWNGAERVAMARASRTALSCGLCTRTRASLSPYGLAGEHVPEDGLSTVALDAVHRVVSNAGRITRDWVDANVHSGLGHEAYVELVGVVVCVLSIDEFHRALGLPLERLPEPRPGNPDGYRPRVLSDDIGFVPTIPKHGAVGNETGLWPAGRSANVLRALTLVPQAMKDWTALADAQYLSIARMANMVKDDERSIDRMQMELVAARVSAVNECFY